jgi:hypothetical protein
MSQSRYRYLSVPLLAFLSISWAPLSLAGESSNCPQEFVISINVDFAQRRHYSAAGRAAGEGIGTI